MNRSKYCNYNVTITVLQRDVFGVELNVASFQNQRTLPALVQI